MLQVNRLLLLKIIDTFYEYFRSFSTTPPYHPKGSIYSLSNALTWPKSLPSYQRFKPRDITNRLELNLVKSSGIKRLYICIR